MIKVLIKIKLNKNYKRQITLIYIHYNYLQLNYRQLNYIFESFMLKKRSIPK